VALNMKRKQARGIGKRGKPKRAATNLLKRERLGCTFQRPRRGGANKKGKNRMIEGGQALVLIALRASRGGQDGCSRLGTRMRIIP